MDPNQIMNIQDEAITATREITDPAARFRQLLDAVRGSTKGDALLDEAADLARNLETPEDRSAARWAAPAGVATSGRGLDRHPFNPGERPCPTASPNPPPSTPPSTLSPVCVR